MKKSSFYVDSLHVLLLILSGGTIIKVIGLTTYFNIVVFSVFLFFSVLNNKLKKNSIFKILFFFINYIFIKLFNFFKNPNLNLFSIQFLNIIIIVFIAHMFTERFKFRNGQFLKIFTSQLNIIFIYALISSLILFVFPTNNIVFTSVSGDNYEGINILLFQQGKYGYFGQSLSLFEIFGFSLRRLHGIFWEPGVLGFFANLYTYIQLFHFRKIKAAFFGSFIIILTWSSTAIFLLIFQLIMAIRKGYIVTKNPYFKPFIYISILLVVGFSAFFFAQNSQEKLYNNISAIGSASQRYYDTLGALNVITNNPISGVGIDYNIISNEIKESFRSININNSLSPFDFNVIEKDEVKFSNSFLRLFIVFGIPIAIYMLYLVYNQQFFVKRKKTVFFDFLFNTIIYTITFSPILFYLYNFRSKRKINDNIIY